MVPYKGRVLVVEDDLSVRTSLSMVLASVGYEVTTAFDGFSALVEMRRALPHVLISDLNMPGMSGFELLYVVRCRFPLIPVIAMSGGFADMDSPIGVASDRFHRKGGSLADLLKMLALMVESADTLEERSAAGTPIWVSLTTRDRQGVESVTLCCPACLRTYKQAVDPGETVIHDAPCVFCSTQVSYGVVQPAHVSQYSYRPESIQ